MDVPADPLNAPRGPGGAGGRFWRAAWGADLMAAASGAIVIERACGWARARRYLAGVAVAVAVQHAGVGALRRWIGPERASPADALTYGRASVGALLAGLVASGVRDRAGAAGRLGWLATVVAVTATDWLDGPLARRYGATRLGAALDIEADSWLTLWSAAAAVRWGGLPGWCLLPPLLRYLHPLLDLRAGRLPVGGGPWWSRATGTAQMALIVAALAPCRRRPSPAAMRGLAAFVGGAQGVALLALVWRRRRDR